MYINVIINDINTTSSPCVEQVTIVMMDKDLYTGQISDADNGVWRPYRPMTASPDFRETTNILQRARLEAEFIWISAFYMYNR